MSLAVGALVAGCPFQTLEMSPVQAGSKAINENSVEDNAQKGAEKQAHKKQEPVPMFVVRIALGELDMQEQPACQLCFQL